MEKFFSVNAWMDPPKVEHNSFFEVPKTLSKSADLMAQLEKRGTYIEYKYTADGNVSMTRKAFQTPLGALEKPSAE